MSSYSSKYLLTKTISSIDASRVDKFKSRRPEMYIDKQKSLNTMFSSANRSLSPIPKRD